MLISISTRVALLTTFLFAVLGAGELRVTPLPNGCASYPGYNNATNEAGPWSAVADSKNSTIDGFKISVESYTNDGVDRFGFVTLPKQWTRFTPNITLRCHSNKLQAILSLTTQTYVDLVISSVENWQAQAGYNLTPSIPIEPYAHYINGERVSGVFLGAKGKTNWFFKYNWAGNAGEYYLVRLAGGAEGLRGGSRKLGKRQDFPTLDDRDWNGFIKIVG